MMHNFAQFNANLIEDIHFTKRNVKVLFVRVSSNFFLWFSGFPFYFSLTELSTSRTERYIDQALRTNVVDLSSFVRDPSKPNLLTYQMFRFVSETRSSIPQCPVELKRFSDFSWLFFKQIVCGLWLLVLQDIIGMNVTFDSYHWNSVFPFEDYKLFLNYYDCNMKRVINGKLVFSIKSSNIDRWSSIYFWMKLGKTRLVLWNLFDMVLELYLLNLLYFWNISMTNFTSRILSQFWM